MLERSHHEAYLVAADRAFRAVGEATPKDAEISEKQMAAILELEKARRDIFAKFGVPDIEPPKLGQPSRRWQDKPYQNDLVVNPSNGEPYKIGELKSIGPEQLEELPIGTVLKIFRLIEGVNQKALARKISDTCAMNLLSAHSLVNKTERGKSNPGLRHIKNFISGFGWEQNDWRAQLLIEKTKPSAPRQNL